jgi:hypothetical protein
MSRVERGNVVLHIDDADIQHYLNMGYSLTDESGKLLQKAIPTTLGEFQKAYLELTVENEQLRKENAELKAQIHSTEKKPSTRSRKTATAEK